MQEKRYIQTARNFACVKKLPKSLEKDWWTSFFKKICSWLWFYPFNRH